MSLLREALFNKQRPVQQLEPTEPKVIGAGLGRTGMPSLYEAMQIIGFAPCHHMLTLAGDTPRRCIAFEPAYAGAPTDWHKLMDGYICTIGNPTADFVPELIEAYPNALVILSVRDSPEAWWNSVSGTIRLVMSVPFGILVFPVTPGRHAWHVVRSIRRHWLRTWDLDELGPEVYTRHNAMIRELVTPEKLLEFNVKQGWAPLCQFLGVPIPGVPFPHANEREEMKKNLRLAIMVGALAWVLILGSTGVGIWAIVYLRLWRYLTVNKLPWGWGGL
ncbi:hypothetical protein CALCODRAFT_504668 [Calocera cornea HHB12733]|uniref:Uncharacterized protein n=1 Tax=Calocera cornea HHB12733 TaxID=1353952 RepID=A0A165CAK5_9BASI|nr:hypothetical protein CALCODRAFT_504668 [Calocera cornea HHB12733]